MSDTWKARVRFPDDQVRVLSLFEEPKPGALLDTDLTGQWLIATVEVNDAPDQLQVPYRLTVDSAEGVSG
jgi:hypothetical protein